MLYSFELPMPPSQNQKIKKGRNGIYKSDKTREYTKIVVDKIKELKLDKENIDYKIKVFLDLYPSTAREYDIDNYEKILFDALTLSGFWRDDRLVFKMIVEKRFKIPGGKCHVQIDKYEDNYK